MPSSSGQKTDSRSRRRFIAACGAALLARAAGAQRHASDKAPQDLVWTDASRKRALRLRLRYPDTAPPWPLILYSPGLGSGVDNGAPWCEAWRDAGLLVVTLSHPETNDDIWRGNLHAQLNISLQGAQLAQRVADCRYVLDGFAQRADLHRMVNPRRIGAAGHSYGALTVQALAGQRYGGKPLYREPRIAAAIALSPGVLPIEAAGGMAGVAIPMLCVTGDLDAHVTFGAGIGNGEQAMRLGVPLENRLAVYNRLLPGGKHQLVLKGADHMTFAGEPIDTARFSRAPGLTPASDPQQWAKVNAITTQFWRRYFPGGGAPNPIIDTSALGAGDRFDSK